jgi:hypothetical protein
MADSFLKVFRYESTVTLTPSIEPTAVRFPNIICKVIQMLNLVVIYKQLFGTNGSSGKTASYNWAQFGTQSHVPGIELRVKNASAVRKCHSTDPLGSMDT